MTPIICAEISGNHGGDFDTAIKLIEAAKAAGADAVKFQAYEADTLTIDCDKPDFIIKEGLWKGRSLYELYSSAHTPMAWLPDLFAKARGIGIEPFASAFDKKGVDLLDKLNSKWIKIASMEIVDLPLIEYAAQTDRQLVISTGMASLEETMDAYEAGRHPIMLVCSSAYPSHVRDFPLNHSIAMPWGVSDHTIGKIIPIAATAMGACMIEKHLCLSRRDKTEDAKFSMDPTGFKHMVSAVRDVVAALMNDNGGEREQASLQFRRSLYVVKDMKAGDTFTEDNVRSIRPSYGLAPKMLPEVLGKKAAADIERGTALHKSMVG